MIWLKEMLPLVIQLLAELFRTDGEQKYGLGLKVAVLVNIMLTAVSGYIAMTYFELYHTTIKTQYELAAVTKSRDEKDLKVIELERKVEKLEAGLGSCVQDTNVPSDSYNHTPERNTPPRRSSTTTRAEEEYDAEYIEALMRSING